MELTDDDRAAAREVALVWGYKEMCDDRYIGIANDSYLAGKRSGMLEAAKIADRFDGHLPADVDGASDAIRAAATLTESC